MAATSSKSQRGHMKELLSAGKRKPAAKRTKPRLPPVAEELAEAELPLGLPPVLPKRSY